MNKEIKNYLKKMKHYLVINILNLFIKNENLI